MAAGLYEGRPARGAATPGLVAADPGPTPLRRQPREGAATWQGTVERKWGLPLRRQPREGAATPQAALRIPAGLASTKAAPRGGCDLPHICRRAGRCRPLRRQPREGLRRFQIAAWRDMPCTPLRRQPREGAATPQQHAPVVAGHASTKAAPRGGCDAIRTECERREAKPLRRQPREGAATMARLRPLRPHDASTKAAPARGLRPHDLFPSVDRGSASTKAAPRGGCDWHRRDEPDAWSSSLYEGSPARGLRLRGNRCRHPEREASTKAAPRGGLRHRFLRPAALPVCASTKAAPRGGCDRGGWSGRGRQLGRPLRRQPREGAATSHARCVRSRGAGLYEGSPARGLRRHVGLRADQRGLASTKAAPRGGCDRRAGRLRRALLGLYEGSPARGLRPRQGVQPQEWYPPLRRQPREGAATIA